MSYIIGYKDFLYEASNEDKKYFSRVRKYAAIGAAGVGIGAASGTFIAHTLGKLSTAYAVGATSSLIVMGAFGGVVSAFLVGLYLYSKDKFKRYTQLLNVSGRVTLAAKYVANNMHKMKDAKAKQAVYHNMRKAKKFSIEEIAKEIVSFKKDLTEFEASALAKGRYK